MLPQNNTYGIRDDNNTDVIMMNTRRMLFSQKEPWQQDWDPERWQETIWEMRNLGAAILWLLIARGLIVRCFRIRRRY